MCIHTYYGEVVVTLICTAATIHIFIPYKRAKFVCSQQSVAEIQFSQQSKAFFKWGQVIQQPKWWWKFHDPSLSCDYDVYVARAVTVNWLTGILTGFNGNLGYQLWQQKTDNLLCFTYKSVMFYIILIKGKMSCWCILLWCFSVCISPTKVFELLEFHLHNFQPSVNTANQQVQFQLLVGRSVN